MAKASKTVGFAVGSLVVIASEAEMFFLGREKVIHHVMDGRLLGRDYVYTIAPVTAVTAETPEGVDRDHMTTALAEDLVSQGEAA